MVLVVQITKDGNGRLTKLQTEAIKEKFHKAVCSLTVVFPEPLRIRFSDLTGKIRLA